MKKLNSKLIKQILVNIALKHSLNIVLKDTLNNTVCRNQKYVLLKQKIKKCHAFEANRIKQGLIQNGWMLEFSRFSASSEWELNQKLHSFFQAVLL